MSSTLKRHLRFASIHSLSFLLLDFLSFLAIVTYRNRIQHSRPQRRIVGMFALLGQPLVKSIFSRPKGKPAIEKVLQAAASPKPFLFKHLWISSLSGLADNGASGCSRVVGTYGLKTRNVMPAYHSKACSAVSLFCGFLRWQLRPPLLGFFGFVPGFVEADQLIQ